jgi:peptidyl-prolyl cis-trans isomerase D
MRRAVLDNLVSQHLVVDRAAAAGLTVSDDQIAQVVGRIEAFQDGGKFDKQRYQAALANQGMTPLMFEARVRDELMSQQIRDVYLQNGYASNSAADNVIRLYEQQRVVSLAPISFQAFISQAMVDESALKNYYENNTREFEIPEQARVEYVQFSVDGLMAKTDVPAAEVRQYYDEHQADFGTAEQRQAAHILIAAAATASQAEQDAAKAKAEALLLQVRKSPGKFGELAKQNSQDPGSAANGGDLGVFARGMMVKPFEDAVFSLKSGEISGLVKSDFGYHIIKLVAVKPARVQSLAEARDGIAAKLRQQKAADKFAELAEKFSNAVYEQSDTLKPAAELAGAKLEQSGWLVKGAAAGGLWTPKVLQVVFSDDVVKNKRNTAALEVAQNTLLAARIIEHKPASVRPLDEVKATILNKLQRLQAIELAVKQGRSTLERLHKGDKPALNWGVAQTVTRGQHGALSAALARQIFQTDSAKLPQYVGAESGQDGYVLVRVEAVKETGQIDDVKRARYVQQLHQMTGEEIFQAYLADAKQHATIEINLSGATPPQP